MITTQTISLDLQKQTYGAVALWAKQGDADTRQIRVAMLENSMPYTIPDGVRAYFRCLKPDGTSCEREAEISDDNAVSIVLSEQMLAVPGALAADIYLVDPEGDILSTASFVIQVEPIPFGTEVESISEFLELREIILKSKELTGQYETALKQLQSIQASAQLAAEKAAESDRNASASKNAASEYARAAALSEKNAASSAAKAKANADAIDPAAFDAKVAQKADNFWQDPQSGLLYLTSNGVPIGDGIKVSTGGSGGGGSSLTYSVSIQNLLDSRVLTVPEGERVELRFRYSSVDSDGMSDGAGIGQLLVAGMVRHTFSAKQGENVLDVTEYLISGTNEISVRIMNSENTAKNMAYTVIVAAVALTAAFDPAVPYSGAISFPFTPVGIAEKVVHFEVDGTELDPVTVATSGRQVSYTVPAQRHGAHVLRVWFTCEIAGTSIISNVLYYSVICVEEGKLAPIIAVTTPPVSGVEQFSNIVKKYRVYDPTGLTANITLEVNGETVSYLTVDRTEQTWTYRPTEVGELVQTIRCGDTYVSWSQSVTESSIQVEAETDALALHLSSYGRSNNEENPGVWENNGISCQFEKFNFVSDGWVQDEDNITVLRVTGDARLHIPYKMFAYDFRTTGKTLEFELATRDVLNYDAEVLQCYTEGRGFVITAQQLRLASEQSLLGTRYKEDEHLRVTFVAEKRSENRLLLCYINGIMSGAVQYPDDDDFSQTVPVGIRIGSNDCTTDLYHIRVYDNSLTRHQVLDNWIVDTQQQEARIARYRRNSIYDAYGRVVISGLPNDLPYLVLRASELPQFKGDKKTCSGYFTDPAHRERSFSFEDAQIDVQGTSSQYYYRKNYKIKFQDGLILYDGTNSAVYCMNDNAVGVDTFTMKADVASSEGAFNVVLSMLYHELCPVKTPAQQENPKVRQTIEGFPVVIFWENGGETKFLGKYNFNNDKGTEEVFGFKTGDESWEILQNGTDRVGWHSADYSGESWKTDFEARYPDKNTNITRLQQLAQWLVTTDTDRATGGAIAPVTYNGVTYDQDTAQYRLAKFDAELEDHFVAEAIEFYYLFTEIFLSIDQREKNAFPTYLKDLDRWIVLFYDADSSCGTDNKGNLAFDYYLEDIDYTEAGDPVYNGQNSVLWKNLRQTRYPQIMELYQNLRTQGRISYESVIGKFQAHQDKWPEAIFNEDMYTKCLEPLILEGDGLYLPMLQGKKEQWMKWWLYNRFRYLDSKYVTGTSMTNRITIRAHEKASIFLKSYVNMYGHVYFNAAHVENRMERGREYEFQWPASGAEDPVIGINDADLLTSLGDLSPLMVELIDVSGAPHITELKVGDGAEDYSNYSLTAITLGNNKLLRTLDCRNCPNLTVAPDVSGCTNIEQIYFEGSGITGLKLPDGGVLKTLHLPGTLANLSIRNQPQLTDFQIPDYSQITTLSLENAGILSGMGLEILSQIPANSRVRLIGFKMQVDSGADIVDFIHYLDTMRGLDENGNNTQFPQISGTVYAGQITPYEHMIISDAKLRYPGLNVVATLVPYTVSFCNYNGRVLQTVYVDTYGAAAVYTGATPVKLNGSEFEDWEFIGWDNDFSCVTGDLVCTAQFRNNVGITHLLVGRKIQSYSNDTITKIGMYAMNYCGSLTSIHIPSVTSFGKYALGFCSALESVYVPNLRSVGEGAFHSCNKLKVIDLPLLSGMIDQYTFTNCTSLESFRVPNAVTVYSNAFQGCSSLTRLEAMGHFHMIRGSVFLNSSLETLILRGDGVSTLSDANCFSNTPIASGSGYIYVPGTLVERYQTATNWSVYAAQIRAIEDYPEICGGES